MDVGPAVRCPLPAHPQGIGSVTSDLCSFLEEAGCPLASPVQERLRFERVLVQGPSDPLETTAYERRSVAIKDVSGKPVFQAEDIEVREPRGEHRG